MPEEQNSTEPQPSTPNSTTQEKLADMIVPVLMTGGLSVGGFGAFWALFKDSDIPKAIASGVIGLGLTYGASLLSPVHQGNHRRLGKFGNWVDRRIDRTIEANFRRMRRLDNKTEITLEPIPEKVIDWMKQKQQSGKFQYVATDAVKAFCLWLTTLAGLQVEGKLFTYRSATDAEIQKIVAVGEADLYIVRQEIHARYAKLMSYLIAGQWKEADQETSKVMLEVAARTERGYLSDEDLQNFSCEDLLTIDRLWVEASNGHFGFSVQKKMWEKCGSPGYSYSGEDKAKWDNFWKQGGWRLEDKLVGHINKFSTYSDYQFSPPLSFRGELPSYLHWEVVINRIPLYAWSLFSRKDL